MNHPKLSQRQKVHICLKAAGPRGVRSDHFLSENIPRAAARVKELRNEGIEISSEREKQYTRYRLVESSAGVPSPQGTDGPIVHRIGSSVALSQEKLVGVGAGSPLHSREGKQGAPIASVDSSQPSPKAEGASQGAPPRLFELTPYEAGWVA